MNWDHFFSKTLFEPDKRLLSYDPERIVSLIKKSGTVIGVPKEIKPNSERVGLTPAGVKFLSSFGLKVLVEKGAGSAHFSDSEYRNAGAVLAGSAGDVWSKASLIKKVKEPLPQEFSLFGPDHVIFTFFHLSSFEIEPLTKALIDKKVTAIAYETIVTYEEGKKRTPVLAPMSAIAGDLGAYFSMLYLLYGNIFPAERRSSLTPEGETLKDHLIRNYPYSSGLLPNTTLSGKKAVILGGGIAGESMALRLLQMGSEVTIVDVRTDVLEELRLHFGGFSDLLKVVKSNDNLHVLPPAVFDALSASDIIGGCVLVPGGKAPQVTDSLLAEISKTKPKVIIDIALDQGGNFAGSYSLTHASPVFMDAHGNIRYCVPNMPDAVGRAAAITLEKANIQYTLLLAAGIEAALKVFPELKDGINTDKGFIVHPQIHKTYPALPYLPYLPYMEGPSL